jgi:hypothetical protein
MPRPPVIMGGKELVELVLLRFQILSHAAS